MSRFRYTNGGDRIQQSAPVWLWVPAICALFLSVGKLVVGNISSPVHHEHTLYADTLSYTFRLPTNDSTLTLYQLPHHPSVKLTPVVPMRTLNGQVLAADPRYQDLYDLFDLYEVRQGRDDNFTMRVLDMRTGETQEVAVLEDEKRAYAESGKADWGIIDKKRRSTTTDLVDKYKKLGLPKDAIAVRWGRQNQVEEARLREEPYITYEIQLAHLLDLSLLACEIGTVETFNQDWLVSRAGAKSRYQMMPDMLRKFGLHQHRLNTASGRQVIIRDERHPMLAMVPAFTLMRAFSNAVGNELAGLSAYHTGHNNIYRLLRLYLDSKTEFLEQEDVMGAYVWALADGYDIVRRRSTFRTQSRGYVPALMGSLRAMEHRPIDLRKTFRADRISLRQGVRSSLSDLITTLDTLDGDIDWGHVVGKKHTLQRFAALNPHIPIPPADTVVSPTNDIRFISNSSSQPIRLFLPSGSAEKIGSLLDLGLDPSSIVHYSETLFSPKPGHKKSEWDRAYEELVDDVGRFGFSRSNQAQLEPIISGLERQAELNPSWRNTIMVDVARVHHTLWKSKYWRQLSDTVIVALGPDREGTPGQTDPLTQPQDVPTTK